MSGIMQKIEETLHMGGGKKEEHKGEAHKPEHGHGYGGDQHKSSEHGHGEHQGEHKEGFMDKVKDKIHGEGGHGAEGEKKKKKEKKKHEHGHDHGDSSSSDSD